MTGAALDLDRLAKLLGLLSSHHDGEILAAAKKAEAIRRDAGLSWSEILAPRLPAPRREREISSTEDAIEVVLENLHALTPWERNFARSIARQSYSLSEKQASVLQRLVRKALHEAQAA
jgi:hypothetical protein